MIIKLIRHLWSLRRQFAKYFIIGTSAFVLDIGSLYVFKEYLKISAVSAVVINQIFIINYVFYLNKNWAFGARGATRQQLMRFYILAGANYLFSILWMWVMHEQFRINYLLARVSNIILAVGWNFLLYKYWIYHVRDKSTRGEESVENTAVN